MTPADHRAGKHLPGRMTIDSYGAGGFRFGGYSHRGSILCLPSGVYAWSAVTPADVSEEALAPVVAERADGAEFLILGMGRRVHWPALAIRALFRSHAIGLEAMDTGAAVRTYNIVMGEGRPVAAALLAVD